MKVTISRSGSRLIVASPFQLKEELKAVSTAKWDGKLKGWTFADTPTVNRQLDAMLKRNGVEVFGVKLKVNEGEPFSRIELTHLKDPPPWPHQVEGVHLIGEKNCYINGGMGVGKSRATVDAITNYDFKRTLILCPASVVRVWPKEIGKYDAVGCVVVPLDKGSIAKRTKLAELKYDVAAASKSSAPHIYVINYEAAWREPFSSFVMGRKWDLVVLDEAHKIKSAKGKQSKWCEDLISVSRRVVGMSGTPMPHGPLDIFGQFRAIDPGIFGDSYTKFRSRYEATYFYVNADAKVDQSRLATLLERSEKFSQTWKQERLLKNDWATDLSLASLAASMGSDDQEIVNLIIAHRRDHRRVEAKSYNHYIPILTKVREGNGQAVSKWKNLDELRSKMDQITLRIDRSVLTLTEATETTRYLELSPEEARVHAELLSSFTAELKKGTVTTNNALARITKLQQVTGGFVKDDDKDIQVLGESRKNALKEALEGLQRDDGSYWPVVVFCRFHRDLDSVREAAIEVTGLPALELSGRVNELAQWQQDGSPPVLAVQIQSGGLGVDLTRASYAIYYSIGYSLGDLDQAKARIHRPGQSRAVTHLFLIASDTIDEAIYEAIQGKRDVVEFIMDKMRGF